MADWISALISGAGSLLGANQSSKGATKAANIAAAAQREANDKNIQLARDMALRQEAFQRELGTNAIQWKVADARAAGIHPLAALGVAPISAPAFPVPQVEAVPGQPNTGSIWGDAISSISRDVAGIVSEQRSLQNDLLRAQIRQADATTSAAIARSRSLVDATRANPSVAGTAPPAPKRLGLRAGAGNIMSDPSWSDSQDWEDRHGEPGEWLSALPRFLADLQFTLTGEATRDAWARFNRRSESFRNSRPLGKFGSRDPARRHEAWEAARRSGGYRTGGSF